MCNDSSKVKYAPLYITTLCRSRHFIREVESLKRNTWAKYTDVYIGLDYPAKESHWSGYNQIKDYLNQSDFSMFASFSVIEHETNKGAAANSREMREYLMSIYDRWIVAEDDLEFSPNFLEYMNVCMEKFKDDPTVFAISGYSYPVTWDAEPAATAIKQNGCCNAWGIGFWREKYVFMRDELKNGCLRNEFKQAVRSGKIDTMSKSRRCEFITHALSGNKGGLFTVCSDLAMGIYIQLHDLCTVTPIISKVRNHGFDGSGLYCDAVVDITNKDSMSYDYVNQPMDENTTFELVMASDRIKENREILDRFLYLSSEVQKQAQFFMKCYRVVGQRNMEMVYQFLKKLKIARK